MAIEVKLEAFEGPLDLLLHLIDINKIDIYDIPIAKITDQYLDYIKQMDREDMNVTSEFLVMAATLLDIKCKMLLPKEVDEEGEEIDPREDLVHQLLEYKMYKYISSQLRDRESDASRNFYRARNIPAEVAKYEPPIDYDTLIGDNTLFTLQEVFHEILRRKEARIDPVRSKFGTIEKQTVDMGVQAAYVKSYLMEHRKTNFRALLEEQPGREEVIVTFLVILEMMKTGDIAITQESTFGEIDIEVKDAEHLAKLDPLLMEEDLEDGAEKDNKAESAD